MKVSGDRREHGEKLFKKRFRLNVRKYAFSNRFIDNWNLLPVSCINFSTTNTFKKHLSSELESEAVKFVSCGSRHYTSKACAYSSLWRHAGVCEFGELSNLVKPKNFNLLSYFQLSIPRNNFVVLLWTYSISLIIFRQVWIPIAAHREILYPTHH